MRVVASSASLKMEVELFLSTSCHLLLDGLFLVPEYKVLAMLAV